MSVLAARTILQTRRGGHAVIDRLPNSQLAYNSSIVGTLISQTYILPSRESSGPAITLEPDRLVPASNVRVAMGLSDGGGLGRGSSGLENELLGGNGGADGGGKREEEEEG